MALFNVGNFLKRPRQPSIIRPAQPQYSDVEDDRAPGARIGSSLQIDVDSIPEDSEERLREKRRRLSLSEYDGSLLHMHPTEHVDLSIPQCASLMPAMPAPPHCSPARQAFIEDVSPLSGLAPSVHEEEAYAVAPVVNDDKTLELRIRLRLFKYKVMHLPAGLWPMLMETSPGVDNRLDDIVVNNAASFMCAACYDPSQ